MDNIILFNRMNRIDYWVLKVGRLYYSGGLGFELQEYPEAQAYEVTTEIEFAFRFLRQDSAERVAAEMGGKVIACTCTLDEYNGLDDKLFSYHEARRQYTERDKTHDSKPVKVTDTINYLSEACHTIYQHPLEENAHYALIFSLGWYLGTLPPGASFPKNMEELMGSIRNLPEDHPARDALFCFEFDPLDQATSERLVRATWEIITNLAPEEGDS